MQSIQFLPGRKEYLSITQHVYLCFFILTVSHFLNCLSPRLSPVSYLISCVCLSDNRRYPLFFHTIPSTAAAQAWAMAGLLGLMGWTRVDLVSVDDEFEIWNSDVNGITQGY